LHRCWLAGVVAGAVIATPAGPAAAAPQPANPWLPNVYVAKGEPNACGAGCREWIAAEGAIDRDAPLRLRALLNRLGERKLPIYLHSPGGSVDAGIAIGRLMRERRITAGVGRLYRAAAIPCATRRRSAMR
jgi:hypothetical protein